MDKLEKHSIFALSEQTKCLTIFKYTIKMEKVKVINIYSCIRFLCRVNRREVMDLLMEGIRVNSEVPIQNRAVGKVEPTDAEQLFAYEIFKAFEVNIPIEVEEQISAIRNKYSILPSYKEFDC